ncbi:uncharacterized protein AB675_9025 [Cyphellophora attinorum]|uniref:F-box domain-containing protein n=1 Tax=Cyphellophora attinorum TaxID=1664694 RepID=A0A0N1NZJ9_9EURO|nr:uncharacterized protein AB675_9025 [Phialophora attinorum]KPI41707.1 hypothetical protein AB675_9025 [Phialophora attinorum]
MECKKQFSDLDDDCIRQIVKLLPQRDLKHFSMVNKQCRALSLDVIFKSVEAFSNREDESLVAATLRSVYRSQDVAPYIRVLSICLLPIWSNLNNTLHSNIDLIQMLTCFLSKYGMVRQLSLVGITLSPQAKRVFGKPVFNEIRVLQIEDFSQPSMLIAACPNLEVFSSTYPIAKPKTTFKAIAEHPQLTSVRLQPYGRKDMHIRGPRGWTRGQLKDICSLLKGVKKLFLAGHLGYNTETLLVNALCVPDGVEWLNLSVEINRHVNNGGLYDEYREMVVSRRMTPRSANRISEGLLRRCPSLLQVDLRFYNVTHSYSAQARVAGTEPKITRVKLACLDAVRPFPGMI